MTDERRTPLASQPEDREDELLDDEERLDAEELDDLEELDEGEDDAEEPPAGTPRPEDSLFPPRPAYGRSAERHLGREIPLWAVGAAAFAVVAIIAFLFSLIGGAPEPAAAPQATTAAAELIAQQATLEALATPTPAPPPTPTPVPTPPPSPQLGPGMRARVVNSNPEGLSIRSAPGRRNRIQAVVKDGAELEILPKPADVESYPVEADGFTWWQVRTNQGLSGWVAEGTDTVSWLEPLSGAAP